MSWQSSEVASALVRQCGCEAVSWQCGAFIIMPGISDKYSPPANPYLARTCIVVRSQSAVSQSLQITRQSIIQSSSHSLDSQSITRQPVQVLRISAIRATQLLHTGTQCKGGLNAGVSSALVEGYLKTGQIQSWICWIAHQMLY